MIPRLRAALAVVLCIIQDPLLCHAPSLTLWRALPLAAASACEHPRPTM
jgi:hypothetical protein